MTEEHTQFEIVPTVTKEEAYRRVIEANSLLLSFDDGHKAVLSAAKKAELMALKQMKDNSTTLTISKQLGVSAYTYQVDNNCLPDESLIYAAIEHNQDPERVLEAKSKTWRHNPYVVRTLPDSFGKQRFGHLSVELKKAVRNSDSILSGLNSVSAFSKLKQKVDGLELLAKEQSEKLEMLSGEALSSKLDIEKIKETSGWVVPNSEKALIMKSQGHSVKSIASILGVTRRTVYRWVSQEIQETVQGTEYMCDTNVPLLSQENANPL